MYQRTVLPNGIRIISEYNPHLRSVTLGAWFEVGSRHERQNEWGISHFIEHLMFKGTKKHTARQIAEIMDQHGGYLNAFTSKEQTCYYFKVLDEHFAVAADILQDMLLNSVFAPEEIRKERNVILEELSMYEDSPEDVVHDLFAKLLWAPGPLGRSILGSEQTINQFNQAKIKMYLDEHYTADRLVIVSVGNLSHDEVIETFAERFIDLPQQTKKSSKQSNPKQGLSVFQDKDLEQVHLCLGGPALSRLDSNRYALYLLDTVLGGSMSSLLFQELREERGLAYNTYSFTSLYQDVGCYGIYAGFNPRHWQQVWDLIQEIFSQVTNWIQQDRFTQIQGQLKGSILLSLESTTTRMTHLADGEFDQGRIVRPEEVVQAIDQVSYEQLLQLAKEIYQPAGWSWAALGPKAEIKGEAICQKIC